MMTSPITGDPLVTSVLLHVTVVPGDLDASLVFYDAALASLGIARHSDFSDEEEAGAPIDAVGYGAPGADPVLWVVAGLTRTTGSHLAIAASSRTAVEEFWRDGLVAGGAAQQAPRAWEIYRKGYFGAILGDPDGNLIEAVATE
jgi:catechol 2,3-dioxygenase-like lactoylglutathione lyase family enzyme